MPQLRGKSAATAAAAAAPAIGMARFTPARFYDVRKRRAMENYFARYLALSARDRETFRQLEQSIDTRAPIFFP